MLTGEVRASANVSNLSEKEKTAASASTTRSTSGGPKTELKKQGRKKRKSKQGTTANESSLVGSVTMWNVPSGAPPLEEDVAFNTVDFMTLVEDYAERQNKQMQSVDRFSVADLFVIHIMQISSVFAS
ncbi:hypothetical protein PHYPSEUDO_013201 [Phytophthora pseudosyringae]|uniref:Uncharacterized protein n=1 Tax=Phytophthora pseudosyringae TaxID=221518 RepID=A0A8T1V687_9STRA|nr:hypothetical protein PHYPSEUDO_013201 [Phytophthora pseudosyringae]